MVSEPTDPTREPELPPTPPVGGRLEGYQPKRPRPADLGEATAATRRERPQPANPRQGRPPARRGRAQSARTVSAAVAALIAAGALGVGLMLGWMARGGPPKAELVVTTQSVPAVTVTKEVSP